MAIFGPVFLALNDADARYVVVGGLAVVLHGYARVTADVDLVIDLDPIQAKKVIRALVAMGFRPRVPVDPESFADPAARESWIRDRGMRVFSMYDPDNPMRVVDLFVEHTIPFEELWPRAEVVRLESATVRIASIPDLIRMKKVANRHQDRIDIEHLEIIQREKHLRENS